MRFSLLKKYWLIWLLFLTNYPFLDKIWCYTSLNFIFSDAIRLFVIKNFGGWYSDLDMVFLKRIDNLKNVLASDDKDVRK